MQIREYYGKEVIKMKKVFLGMFRTGNKNLEDEEAYGKILEEEDRLKGKDFVRLGYFDGDRLCASLRSDPFEVYLDGNIVKMSGIGGVVCDINVPKKGLIKELFIKMFEMMRERDQIVSHLYPFKANYYRKFGYELLCKNYTWKIPTEYIPDNKYGYYVYYDGSEKMQNDIKRVYGEFAKKYNMCVIKDDTYWNNYFKNINPYDGIRFAYLHYTDGVCDAFMQYKVNSYDNKPQDLVVNDLWFTSIKAIKGILSYFVTQKSYADRVWVKTPANIELSAVCEFMGGWGKRLANCEIGYDGTSRVVDVEKIFYKVKYRGEGSVTIKIVDDIYCPWNNDTFTVSFGEKTEVKRGGDPDIVLDIKAFSAMIFGAIDFSDSQIFENVEILANEENLEKVFYKKNAYIDVRF